MAETAEEIAQHFSAMDDSVALIAAIVARLCNEAHFTQIAEFIDETVKICLEIQKEKAWYKASSKTKTPYTNAITTGKAYVAG